MRFIEVNDLFLETLQNCVPTDSWSHRFTFCVQISQKWCTWKWVKRCVVLLTKKLQNAGFFPAPFCTRLAEGAKSRVACHVTLRLPVKFRPNRFRFAAVIPKKWFRTNTILCFQCIKILRQQLFQATFSIFSRPRCDDDQVSQMSKQTVGQCFTK